MCLLTLWTGQCRVLACLRGGIGGLHYGPARTGLRNRRIRRLSTSLSLLPGGRHSKASIFASAPYLASAPAEPLSQIVRHDSKSPCSAGKATHRAAAEPVGVPLGGAPHSPTALPRSSGASYLGRLPVAPAGRPRLPRPPDVRTSRHFRNGAEPSAKCRFRRTKLLPF